MRRGRRLDEIGAGLGPASVPFSQAPQEDPLMGMLDPAKQAEAIAAMQAAGAGGEEEDEEMMQGAPPPASPAPGMEAVPSPTGAPMSDQLTDDDLAAMVGEGSQPQDPQVAQVIAALEDPNTDPAIRQQIETMMAMAARRRMAGLQS